MYVRFRCVERAGQHKLLWMGPGLHYKGGTWRGPIAILCSPAGTFSRTQVSGRSIERVLAPFTALPRGLAIQGDQFTRRLSSRAGLPNIRYCGVVNVQLAYASEISAQTMLMPFP